MDRVYDLSCMVAVKDVFRFESNACWEYSLLCLDLDLYSVNDLFAFKLRHIRKGYRDHLVFFRDVELLREFIKLVFFFKRSVVVSCAVQETDGECGDDAVLSLCRRGHLFVNRSLEYESVLSAFSVYSLSVLLYCYNTLLILGDLISVLLAGNSECSSVREDIYINFSCLLDFFFLGADGQDGVSVDGKLCIRRINVFLPAGVSLNAVLGHLESLC